MIFNENSDTEVRKCKKQQQACTATVKRSKTWCQLLTGNICCWFGSVRVKMMENVLWQRKFYNQTINTREKLKIYHLNKRLLMITWKCQPVESTFYVSRGVDAKVPSIEGPGDAGCPHSLHLGVADLLLCRKANLEPLSNRRHLDDDGYSTQLPKSDLSEFNDCVGI